MINSQCNHMPCIEQMAFRINAFCTEKPNAIFQEGRYQLFYLIVRHIVPIPMDQDKHFGTSLF